MNKMKLWLEELRAPFFTASIVPVLLGASVAWAETKVIHWGYFLLTLIGGMLLHAGTNIANDYFDHKSKNDEINTEYIRPFTGGSRLIQKGLLTPKEVLTESLICFILGSIIGLYLVYQRGIVILWLGLIGIVSGFFYTAKPFYWAKRGIGELVVGLNFGVLMCLGAYFVQTQSINLVPIAAAIPVSLLIAAVLYINEFPDFKADRDVGKNHLVVRLGRKNAVTGYILLMVFTYFSILLGVLTKVIPIVALFVFVTLPIVVKSIKILKKYYEESEKLAPSCAATIQLHLSIGLILTGSYVITLIL